VILERLGMTLYQWEEGMVKDAGAEDSPHSQRCIGTTNAGYNEMYCQLASHDTFAM
jgi:hypothetical protein